MAAGALVLQGFPGSGFLFGVNRCCFTASRKYDLLADRGAVVFLLLCQFLEGTNLGRRKGLSCYWRSLHITTVHRMRIKVLPVTGRQKGEIEKSCSEVLKVKVMNILLPGDRTVAVVAGAPFLKRGFSSPPARETEADFLFKKFLKPGSS